MNKKQTEQLWREEKYHVMFHSQNHYNSIRQAMKDNLSYDEVAQLITDAHNQKATNGSMRNACQHMWGYFKKCASAEEKMQYERLLEEANFSGLLKFLKGLARKYEVKYLLESRILKD